MNGVGANPWADLLKPETSAVLPPSVLDASTACRQAQVSAVKHRQCVAGRV
jgi:hypothetical protein